MGKVLQTCQIIIWDECTMSHKKALEALDRTLRDFRGNRRIFGGALILLSSDFRQTLPIISRSTPADELHACLKSSVLWRHLQKLTLKTNMRVQLQRDASAGNFAKQLMDIENGRMEIDESTQCITLPANLCKIIESIDELVQKVFPNIAQNYKKPSVAHETTTYKFIDTVENQDEVVNYPTEFLNSLDLPGMPPHVLTLKIGVPIILLRNINPPRLCNGTRLSVKKMMNNVIEATILTGKFKGEDVLLPRIKMIPTDMPFEFKRLQFPASEKQVGRIFVGNSGSQKVECTVAEGQDVPGTQMIARIGTNNVASIDSTPLTSFQTSSAIKRNHKRRLTEVGLRSRRPLRRLPLTPHHRQCQLDFCRSGKV
ncbi:ATP-dependent DNA helicase [Trichonephila clavipes]|uniref:ATP-dependent DNA helicase n=1 Tax=Trichonephila clavipes TaxID=2585209 RepID=A0A8X6T3T6_TRICX|nr:ATP-dependent DNA helicase [Trichonephila clavipes]